MQVTLERPSLNISIARCPKPDLEKKIETQATTEDKITRTSWQGSTSTSKA